MSSRSKGCILVVDDEPGIRETLTGVLEDEGYEVESVASGEACLERLAARVFPVVLLDIWLPGIDGLETLARITNLSPACTAVVIVISGHGNIETAVRATKLGAFDFLEKPLSIAKVTVAVRNALEHRRLSIRNREFEAEARLKHRILGDSIPMKALRQQIDLMAPTNGRVLIFGESGSGKELVARALHAKSNRSQASFVEVNCAAIPEELIESELFGHVKGSLAGAGEDKIGKFQQADGGSLFLDEVGDMSLKTQSKVLRVLEEQQRFEPVGSGRAAQVDVRVIAATNKDIEGEIERGNFREDLFYRLNVVPFYVPPLRERVEDIRCSHSIFSMNSREPTGAGRAAWRRRPRTAPGAALAGERPRVAQPDGAHRHHEPAGADRRGADSAAGAPRALSPSGVVGLHQPRGGAQSLRARLRFAHARIGRHGT